MHTHTKTSKQTNLAGVSERNSPEKVSGNISVHRIPNESIADRVHNKNKKLVKISSYQVPKPTVKSSSKTVEVQEGP